jgi:lactoylglutathione lyase
MFLSVPMVPAFRAKWCRRQPIQMTPLMTYNWPLITAIELRKNRTMQMKNKQSRLAAALMCALSFTLAVVFGCRTGPATAGTGPKPSTTMHRAKEALDVGVVVRNVEASLKFYRDVLGLEFVQRLPTATGTGTMCRLRFGESDFKLVEVPNTPPAGAVGLTAQLGFRYVTFLVKDLSGLCRRLQDNHVPFLMPEHESRPGVRFTMVQDPDGNIIELVELDPNIKSDFK